MQIRSLIIALVTATLLGGCSLVHRIDIPQGNYIEAKQVQKLRLGMTKAQVEFVLGTPMTKNAFDANRWDYIHYRKSGSDGSILNKKLSAYFDKQGKLEKVTGDYPVSPLFSQKQQ
ncbi:outer membrane protein assembly factor BamE [Dongshaea marina]|uniref:outer membrane protein assembly factor BamE n=1 Tax=Dongshaea marina TaxID=2047966 RepID=UPI000D3E4CFF|nr:outer membrane protein assembly factor BamE [Dongshaea marina]